MSANQRHNKKQNPQPNHDATRVEHRFASKRDDGLRDHSVAGFTVRELVAKREPGRVAQDEQNRSAKPEFPKAEEPYDIHADHAQKSKRRSGRRGPFFKKFRYLIAVDSCYIGLEREAESREQQGKEDERQKWHHLSLSKIRCVAGGSFGLRHDEIRIRIHQK